MRERPSFLKGRLSCTNTACSAIFEREKGGEDPLESFIIDAEIAAIERGTGHILPFQELAQRKRKDVQESEVSIDPVILWRHV